MDHFENVKGDTEAAAAGQALAASYRFSAQSVGDSSVPGRPAPSLQISGAIDASSPDSAQQTLEALRLRVLSLEPDAKLGPVRAIRGSDFLAFNQQLAYMTQAGLPMEEGLRLIAQDLNRGRLSATVQRVADELKAGKSLSEAFSSHRGAFPPLYSAVLEAGVRTGNLPGVLMGLGRHLELMQRLRAAVWRSIAYPLVVFFGVLLMLGVLGFVLVPQFREIYEDFDIRLPLLTEFVLASATYMPAIMIGIVAFIAACLVLTATLRMYGREQALIDKLLWIPLLGSAISRNMLSRWCDALSLGLNAGLDLPGALDVAAGVLRSGPLNRDTLAMVNAIEQGRAIRGNVRLRFVPEAVPAAVELASHANDLPGMLKSLSELYQQQAEARVAALGMVLGPMMLILIAGVIGVVVTAMFLPMLNVMNSLM